jgi:Structure-specific recognition protein (SSRP1)
MQGNNSGIAIKQTQMINGWSWGEIKIQDNTIKFESNNQDWFNIETNSISNVLVANKNEVGIEFNVDDDIGQG